MPSPDTQARAEKAEHETFDHLIPEHQSDHGERPRRHQAEIDAHAHGDEEQPHEQPLERLDVRFEGMPVFGTSQEHARQERSEAHGDPGGVHQEGDAQDEEQGEARKHLAHSGARENAQHGAGQKPADQHDQGNGSQYLPRRDPGRGSTPVRSNLAAGRQQRHQCQERDGGHVLEEQNGEGRLARWAGHEPALHHRLHRDCRRREPQGEPDDERRLPGRTKEPGGRRQGRGARSELECAASEHAAPHLPELSRVELEADDEEHQHDANFREV